MMRDIQLKTPSLHHAWSGDVSSLVAEKAAIKALLSNLNSAVYLVSNHGDIAATNQGSLGPESTTNQALGFAPPMRPEQLGDPAYMAYHKVKYALYGGSMANGISSEEMVIALGKEGILSSFGAAGLLPSRIEEAITKIQAALPNGPYAFNLIHSPTEPALEREAVKLYLERGVKTLEASAYLGLTEPLVHYRIAGLKKGANGEILTLNKVIAKISRMETATRFMSPAPANFVESLLQAGKITADQAELAKLVPMADDVIVEADSGGHTDNRPLVSLLPSIISLRNRILKEQNYNQLIRVGAGGGIGTPEAALATFSMGAAFIVTGSINQACIESGTSDHVRKLLAQAEMADVIMAPASDMFEMGVKLQVLKRGTLFPMRALKLWEFYSAYNSIDEIPALERAKLEKQTFQAPLEEIWEECVRFFNERDPETIQKCEGHPKRKMALIFRWYLGLSSRWANANVKGREMDYQIWCGPAMGSFNEWTKGTSFEKPEERTVAKVSLALLESTAYLNRMELLKSQGLAFSDYYTETKPH